MTRKALGRGISALIANTPMQGDELLDVDLDLIESNPDQPRSVFAEEKLEELAQSIKVNGLVQPILLRRLGNGRYQIVAGERRWRASQRAGLPRVKAIVREVADSQLLEIALVENIQRQELNPIEEAQAYYRLINNLGITQEEVAQRVGKDRSSVANYLRLLKLPERVQKMLEGDEITMGHARALLGLDLAESQVKLAEEIAKRKLSVRETERAVQSKESSNSDKVISTQIPNDANIRAAEMKLKRHLGTQVRVLMKASGGKIEIEFASMGELDRIYSLILTKDTAPVDIH